MSLVERTIDRLRRGGTKPGAEHVIRPVAQRTSGHVVENAGQVPPDVIIDLEAVRAAGYLPESGQDRVFADEYRQIKRPLIATAFGPVSEDANGDPRVIMMASALPGDGKTFTSINLALSMARERDTSVVLVDADIPKPHVSQIFGVENEIGLLDGLADHSLKAESLVLSTSIRGLSILPAGSRGELATELLASERMSSLIAELLRENPRRLVLLDSSPLLVSSESRALARVAGQVVLVVRSGNTPRQAVLDAIELVEEGKSMSLVLNQSRQSLLGSYYGYGTYGNTAANG